MERINVVDAVRTSPAAQLPGIQPATIFNTQPQRGLKFLSEHKTWTALLRNNDREMESVMEPLLKLWNIGQDVKGVEENAPALSGMSLSFLHHS